MPELNDQNFYYNDLRGRMLGNKAREHLILQEIEKLGKNDFFLEVGCAQGYFEKIASKISNNVFGADCAFDKMPRQCKSKFVGINAEDLPFKSKSFDFVLCTEVLEHVPDWKSALKELQRVSRKKILITIPLEKGYLWRTISKFSSMKSRGHLHKLDSAEVVSNVEKNWKVAKYEVVSTPSRRLNKLIGKMAKEKIGMYTMLLLEKAK